MRDICKENSVDIIIPIYNAYDDLVKCLESIYKYTDLKRNRLILINDNSPDERIRPYLDQQKQKNTIVFHNENNAGFSSNVNLGMRQSENNDVILLNSDTVVTERWVEKIVECAYDDEAIGTVTPLSNNATLCSVPKFCEENLLPEYLNIDLAGAIVERCSMKKYPRITVAHGFCMYIKREVIDTIGYFDAETFELGYGEENDFCNRAEQAGYYHVMCDDTYIYHSGTKSFVSKEKEKLIRQHDRILRDRYPEQMHYNDVHVRDNPNRFVGENVGIYFDLANGRKNILYVLQSDFRKGAADNVGGTQFHVRDLVSGMRSEYNVFVAARNGSYLDLTVYYGEKERIFRFFIGSLKNIYEFKNRTLKNLWENIIAAFHIDLIHVHHVISTSFDIFYVAKTFGVPLVLTLHDFYFICPSVTLTRKDKGHDVCCLGCNMDCKECLSSSMCITDRLDYIKIWREKCAEVLNICKMLFIPDEGVRDIFLSYYPHIKDKLEVVEHGYEVTDTVDQEVICSNDVITMYERVEKEGELYKIKGWAYLRNKNGNTGENIYLQIKNLSGIETLVPTARVDRPDVITDSKKSKVGYSCAVPQNLLDGDRLQVRVVLNNENRFIYAIDTFETPKLPTPKMSLVKKGKKLNVAFIGGLNKAKGGEVVNNIIKNFDGEVNWYIFGGIGVEELACQKRDNLIKTGCYIPEDLPVLLKIHEIDVVGILSIWPETYSYTLTEAILSSVPVIVTDIGALGRRVREAKCGWTISLDHIEEEFLKVIERLINDRAQLETYKESISKIKFPTIDQMADKYKRFYERMWNEYSTYLKADYAMIFEGCKMDNQGKESNQNFTKQGAAMNDSEQGDKFYQFKRYLQNNHPSLYYFLRRVKGG